MEDEVETVFFEAGELSKFQVLSAGIVGSIQNEDTFRLRISLRGFVFNVYNHSRPTCITFSIARAAAGHAGRGRARVADAAAGGLYAGLNLEEGRGRGCGGGGHGREGRGGRGKGRRGKGRLR